MCGFAKERRVFAGKRRLNEKKLLILNFYIIGRYGSFL